jgi:hypothetical protein
VEGILVIRRQRVEKLRFKFTLHHGGEEGCRRLKTCPTSAAIS